MEFILEIWRGCDLFYHAEELVGADHVGFTTEHWSSLQFHVGKYKLLEFGRLLGASFEERTLQYRTMVRVLWEESRSLHRSSASMH